LDPAYLRSRLTPSAPRHVVVLFHGMQMDPVLPEWIAPFIDAVFKRIDADAAAGKPRPDLRLAVFDWTAHSFSGVRRHYLLRKDETMRPYSVMAGYAAARSLADAGLLAPPGSGQQLHFVAHSRGSAPASLAIRLLREAGIPVQHLTLLDTIDPLTPHKNLERINDPPPRPDEADFCDNYFVDPYFAGGLDISNYFLAGNARREASVNVHLKYLDHMLSHDLYIATIADPAMPWGWQWSAAAGGFDPKRRVTGTIEVERPRVFVEGPAAELAEVEHVLLTRKAAGEPWVEKARGFGPMGRSLMPGEYRLTLRHRDGRPAALRCGIVRHRFGAGPEGDAAESARDFADGEMTFAVRFAEFGTDHVVRLIHP
jgi:hypothetical protein